MSFISQTLAEFKPDQTLIKEYKNWYVLLREKQVTLGSLILLCKDNVDQFSQITPESIIELGAVTKQLETALKHGFCFDKINYLMLMMVDPAVHFHVIPRYSTDRECVGVQFKDFGWDTKLPEVRMTNEITSDTFQAIRLHIRNLFESNS